MLIETPAIICAVRAHGEHGAIVRAMTPDHGLLAGYVAGGKSRSMRPVLIPANIVMCSFQVRNGAQLASLSAELVHSRGPLMSEPLAAAALDWATALTAATLPEEQPHTNLYSALDGHLSAIEAAPAARDWAATLVRYELLLLSELGFGLNLSACAVTGSREDLIYVSPKSATAVSRVAGAAHKDRLLPLPAFIRAGSAADWPELLDGLALSGYFLKRDLLGHLRYDVMAARERLLDRLKRAVA
jgi:DNA repair protein RecO (recombination protein O)